jgi:hypothetical protein
VEIGWCLREEKTLLKKIWGCNWYIFFFERPYSCVVAMVKEYICFGRGYTRERNWCVCKNQQAMQRGVLVLGGENVHVATDKI